MKRTLYLILFVSLAARGQNCEGYFPMNKGAIMESTTYNEKDKPLSKVTVTVQDVLTQGGAVKLTLHSDINDEKGKAISSADYDALCNDGNFSINMKSMLSGEQMKAWKDMSVKIDAEDIVYPVDMSAGQTLKDAHLKVELSMSGMNMPGTTIDMTNRKVVGTETITTSAGTFDCIKVVSDVKFKNIVGYEAQVSEWISKGNGIIRSETFKNGKLKSYTVLTKLQK